MFIFVDDFVECFGIDLFDLIGQLHDVYASQELEHLLVVGQIAFVFKWNEC